MFFVLILFVTATIIFGSIPDIWVNKQNWMINVIKNNEYNNKYAPDESVFIFSEKWGNLY